MNQRTRSKTFKMTGTDSTSDKLDTVLAKMDDLLRSRDLQETKLNSILEKLAGLESSQQKTADDVNALKDSYSALNEQTSEVNNELSLKATCEELTSLEKKMEDLENRSKRNNIVIWGLKEGTEAAHNSFESFLEVEFFEKHMQLENIEVMRAHRTNVSQRATNEDIPPARPIHVYLLRYSDKVQILKVAARALKDNPFLESQIFISDDVSKNVRKDRAKLRKFHLSGIKDREDVEFAFIPWSVPAQILFKERDCSKLKSFKLPDE